MASVVLIGSKILKRFNLSLPKPKDKVSANLTSKYPTKYKVDNRKTVMRKKSFINIKKFSLSNFKSYILNNE